MDQQRLIKKINWMIQQKEHAIKDAEWAKAKEEEEKARKPVNPHIEEIEACDQLISYCKRYMGLDKKEEIKKDEIRAPEKALEVGKGGIVLLEKKRDDELVPKGKKKGKNRNDRRKNNPKEEDKLDIDIGTLGLFDKTQVQPPLSFKALPETLEKLIQKKKYFEELPPEPETTEVDRKSVV